MSSDEDASASESNSNESEDPCDPEHKWLSRRYKRILSLLRDTDDEQKFLEHIKNRACFDFEYTFQDPAAYKGEKTCLFSEACKQSMWSVVEYMLPRVSRIMWFELMYIFGHVTKQESVEDDNSISELSEATWLKFEETPKRGGYFVDALYRGDAKRHYERGFNDPVTLMIADDRCSNALFRRLLRAQPDKASHAMLLCMVPTVFRPKAFEWLIREHKAVALNVAAVLETLEKWINSSGEHLRARYGDVTLRMLDVMCNAVADVEIRMPDIHKQLVLNDLLLHMLALHSKSDEFAHLEQHMAVLLRAGAAPSGAVMPISLFKLVEETTTEQPCKECRGKGTIMITKRKRDGEE